MSLENESNMNPQITYDHIKKVVEKSRYGINLRKEERVIIAAYGPFIDSSNYESNPWSSYLLPLRRELCFDKKLGIYVIPDEKELMSLLDISKYYPTYIVILTKEYHIPEIESVFHESKNPNNVLIIYNINKDNVDKLLEKGYKQVEGL